MRFAAADSSDGQLCTAQQCRSDTSSPDAFSERVRIAGPISGSLVGTDNCADITPEPFSGPLHIPCADNQTAADSRFIRYRLFRFFVWFKQRFLVRIGVFEFHRFRNFEFSRLLSGLFIQCRYDPCHSEQFSGRNSNHAAAGFPITQSNRSNSCRNRYRDR